MTGEPSVADRLVEDFETGQITRGELLRRAAAFGISMSAIGTMLGRTGSASAATRASGTLRVYGWVDCFPGQADPALSGSGTRASGWDGIFEGLVRYDSVGPHDVGKKYKIVNQLAESIDVSSDGKQISFKLKKGIKFHQGFGEVTADDVKYSIERVAGLQKLYPDAADGDASYYASDWQGLLDHVKTTGKYSGVIVLKEANTPVETLNLPYSASGIIVSKKAVQKYGKAQTPFMPVGTGPYQYASFDKSNATFTVEKFPGWSQHDDMRQDWDQIEYIKGSLVGPGQPNTVPLEAGEVDIVAGGGSGVLTAFDVQRLRSDSRFQTYVEPTLSYAFIAINPQYPTLKDVRVRQAIRYAIDVDAILAVLQVSPSNRARAIVSPALPSGYWPQAPRYAHDPAKAKSLLQAAGVSSLRVGIYHGLKTDASFAVIQQNLADVGIQAYRVTSQQDLKGWTTDPKVGQITTSLFGGGPDPFYQFEWWTCQQVGVYNYALWCDQRYTALQAQIGKVRDPARRRAIAISMQKLMDQAATFIWLYYPNYYYLSTKQTRLRFDPAGAYYPSQTVRA